MHSTDKKKKRRNNGKNWYEQDGKYESILYVQPTNGSELKKEAEKLVRSLKLKVKVVEGNGRSLKGLIQRSDPFVKSLCGREGCKACELNKDINCRERDCVYAMKCLDCEENGKRQEYRGQTGRSLGERIEEHFIIGEGRIRDTH